MPERESTPEEVLAIFFLFLVLILMSFWLAKPFFAYFQMYVSLKEARLYVTLGDWIPFLFQGELREYCLAALQYANEYGVGKADVKFDGVFSPYYIMIDKSGYITDIPENLYQSFYWFNYALASIPGSLLMVSLYKSFSARLERYDIKKAGYKQVLLYKEIGINERPFNKDASNKRGVFNVMDYLIPNVDAQKVDKYVTDSVRISLKNYNPNFAKLGEKKSREFRRFVRDKLDSLRKEAAAYWRDKLSSDMLFKHVEGNTDKMLALLKEFGENKNVGASEFFSSKIGRGSYSYTTEKQSQFDYWLKAELSDFRIDAEYYLNMITPKREDKIENKFKVMIDFDNKINAIKIAFTEFGYDKTGQQRAYKADMDNIEDIIERDKANNENRVEYDPDEARVLLEKEVKDRYSDHIRQEEEYTYENSGDGLKDYILFSKFYHRKTKRNNKDDPLPLPAASEIIRIIENGSSDEKAKLEKIFASHYYPDDKLEQYGRVMPLPVYIMTPIRSVNVTDQVRFKKINGGKSTYTFLSEGANVFLEILIERILFSFEKSVKATAATLEADSKNADEENKNTLLKLKAEIEKMLATGEKDARRTHIDRLLEIHRFEETFLMGLLAYGRTLLNLPVGVIGAKVKRTNPALWYAMTALGRTYAYNVSYPIQAMYEYEVRQSYKLADVKAKEAVKNATDSEEGDEGGEWGRGDDFSPEIDNSTLDSSADYSYEDKAKESDPTALPRRENADRREYLGPTQRIGEKSSTAYNKDFIMGDNLFGYT